MNRMDAKMAPVQEDEQQRQYQRYQQARARLYMLLVCSILLVINPLFLFWPHRTFTPSQQGLQALIHDNTVRGYWLCGAWLVVCALYTAATIRLERRYAAVKAAQADRERRPKFRLGRTYHAAPAPVGEEKPG
jgi:hypothetical protein